MGVSDFFVATLPERLPILSDQLIQHNVYLNWIREKGRLIMRCGGDGFTFPVRSGESSLVRAIGDNTVGKAKTANGVEVLELALARVLDIPADYVVLAAGMVPNEKSTGKLHDILKVPRGADGFFMERHAKLGPVETTSEGVFLAGCVSGPKDIADSLAQGSAAAAKAAAIISHDTVELEPTTCVVQAELCRGCSICVDMCEYHAPTLKETRDGLKVAEINQALCKGCGTCASWCPTGAMVALHFTDEQINSMIDALLLDRV